MKTIEFWDEKGSLKILPIKKLDDVTCDRRDCNVFGTFWKCYKEAHYQCTLYKNWMKEVEKYRDNI